MSDKKDKKQTLEKFSTGFDYQNSQTISIREQDTYRTAMDFLTVQ